MPKVSQPKIGLIQWIVFVLSVTKKWGKLFQFWPPGGVTCISCKFGLQMVLFCWLQLWPPDGASYIGSNFGHHLALHFKSVVIAIIITKTKMSGDVGALRHIIIVVLSYCGNSIDHFVTKVFISEGWGKFWKFINLVNGHFPREISVIGIILHWKWYLD